MLFIEVTVWNFGLLTPETHLDLWEALKVLTFHKSASFAVKGIMLFLPSPASLKAQLLWCLDVG